MPTTVGPIDSLQFNSVSALTAQPDGSVSLTTGQDGYPGAEFNFSSEGAILVNGVPFGGAEEEVAPEAWKAATLLNGWVNNGDTANYKQSTAAYRKTVDGKHVELNGLVKGNAAGTNIFNLPIGYRPTTQRARPVVCAANGDTVGFVKIQPNGNVLFSAGAAGLVFLTDVMFALD